MNRYKSHADQRVKKSLLALSVGFCLFFSQSCGIFELRESYIEQESVNMPSIQEESHIPNDNIISPITDNKEYYVINPQAQEWCAHYESKNGTGTSSQTIMLHDEIIMRNKEIIDECDTVYDLADYPDVIGGDKLSSMILSYQIPPVGKYDFDGNPITADMLDQIHQNRNIAGISDSVAVGYGLVSNRCDMKGLPTDLGVFNYGDKYYSSIQETELVVGMPVIVLHSSLDGDFLFVQAYNYFGWIRSDSVGICDKDALKTYLLSDRYITIIKKHISVVDIRLDMGVRLPYISENYNSFTVSLPHSDLNGQLVFTEAVISKHDSVFGSLDYTMENYYNQAFEYLGTDYGWGGADGGVDCSGFVVSVFRTFGFDLPRNTGELRKFFGKSVSFASLSSADISRAFDETTAPSAVHSSSHIMLYLGNKDGIHYVIHAPSGGQKISIMPLDIPGNLLSLSEMKN